MSCILYVAHIRTCEVHVYCINTYSPHVCVCSMYILIYIIYIYYAYVLCGCNVWYSMCGHMYAYVYCMMHRIFFNLYDYILCILLHM